MTNQNEQNVQNTTPEQKKEQIVHWGVKLPVSVKNRLSETLAQWKTDPLETQAETIVKVLDAAVMTGHDIPEEVQRTTGETRDAVMVLLKRINSIGASAALTVDDLHAQLSKQINANEELVQKHKEEIEKLNEQNKATVEELKNQLKTARDDSSKIIEDYSQLKSRSEALQAAQKAFEGQVKGLEDRNQELKQRLADKEKELQHEKLMREDDRDTYNMTMEDKEKAANKALEDAQKLAEAKKEAQIAQAVAAKQAELFDKFTQEKQQLTDEKAELKAQVASLQAEMAALKQQFEVLKQQKAEKGK